MILFHFNAIVQPTDFASGLVAPSAVHAVVNPGRKPTPTEAVRTLADEPSDLDRIAHYFRDEIAAFDRDLEHRANLAEFTASYERGFIHA